MIEGDGVKTSRAAPDLARPFADAAEAWIWCMGKLVEARTSGKPASQDRDPPRPCDAGDIVTVLDRLYRQRRVGLGHARILRIWGERGRAPSAIAAMERGDARLWNEAMVALEWPLRVKGIVRGEVR